MFADLSLGVENGAVSCGRDPPLLAGVVVVVCCIALGLKWVEMELLTGFACLSAVCGIGFGAGCGAEL